jgi:hypothetical protein
MNPPDDRPKSEEITLFAHLVPRPFPLATAAGAFLTAMATALLVDAVLAGFTAALAVTPASGAPPWWVSAHLVERSRWIVLALLGLLVGRQLERPGADTPAVWRVVGLAVIAVPVAWFAAGWIVQAVLFTLAGRWDVDGRAYLAADYYRRLLTGYVPWLFGGAATVAASRHFR